MWWLTHSQQAYRATTARTGVTINARLVRTVIQIIINLFWLGMLTSLNRDKSQIFFLHSRIKFVEVEYREMTLGHTQCTWMTQSVWLPDRGWPAGHPGKDGGKCHWSLGRHCLLWRVVRLLKAFVHAFCAYTSDPVSLHCNYNLYNLWLQLAVAGHTSVR